eukprot:11170464-Heterocapsa_arctica.AAC.1
MRDAGKRATASILSEQLNGSETKSHRHLARGQLTCGVCDLRSGLAPLDEMEDTPGAASSTDAVLDGAPWPRD